MKYLVALSLFVFSLLGASAAEACSSKNDCDCWCKQHSESPICSSCPKSSGHNLIAVGEMSDPFQTLGTYCANPWDGKEGPDFEAAQRQADQKALEQCYPLQIRRISAYQNGTFQRCPEHFWGSQAIATYSCAK
jgi:hypothetical protein